MNTSLFVSRFACSLGLLSLLACGDKAEAPAAAGPAGATSAASSASAPAAPMAPVTVTTVPARKRDLPVLLKASGIVTPLTSVDGSGLIMGQRALQLLIDRIERNHQSASADRQVRMVLQPKLCIRRSCGCSPLQGDDPE